MLDYIDDYGMYHNEPVSITKEASSNNPWIFTAIAKHLNLPVDNQLVYNYYLKCKTSTYPLKVDRRPNLKEPPTSFDEIVGMSSLGVLDYNALKDSHFQYDNSPNTKPIPLYKINWFKLPLELWKLRNAHRNEVWKSKDYPNARVLNFRLRPDYTFYIQQLAYNRGTTKDKPNLLHKAYFYITTYISLKSNRTSTKNIRWVMLRDLGMEDSFLYKMIDIKAQIEDYFEVGSPFREIVK